MMTQEENLPRYGSLWWRNDRHDDYTHRVLGLDVMTGKASVCLQTYYRGKPSSASPAPTWWYWNWDEWRPVIRITTQIVQIPDHL
jgi:hypothetical protein